MSQETTREVYNNGHCRVVVELYPPETELYRNSSDNLVSIRPFATVRIFAKDFKQGSSWKWHVFPGNDVVKRTTGRLWWKNTVTVSESTQEERLEKMIFDTVRFADHHFEDFKANIAAGEVAIKNADNIISAIKEVNKITAANVE